MRLVRKVATQKWRSAQWARADHLPADAFADLRTTDNTLSFWRVGDSPEELDEAILAILGTLTRVDKIEVLALPVEAFDGLSYMEIPGDSCVTELNNLHVDLVELNQVSLIEAASRLAPAIFNNEARLITQKDARQRLEAARQNGRISKVSKTMAESMKWEI